MNPGAIVCHVCGRDSTTFNVKKTSPTLGWGCLLVILAVFGIGYCASHSTPTTSTSTATHGQRAHAAAAAPDPCDVALDSEKKSSVALGASSYQSAFDAAVKGLAANESCSGTDASLVNRAFLLSMKGLAEHHLSQGDSRTDLNQANTLLVECQTQPDLYGTKTGASCETQEQYNISAQTNWDMNQ
jgi:hypothetical protein